MSTEQYSRNPTMFKSNPFGFILCILLLPIGIFILLWWYLVARTTRFTIDEREIRFEKGILNRDYSEVSRSTVRTVKVRQSLLNRIMGVGTIEIYTAGDTPEIVATGMPEPHRIRELIN